MSCVTLLPRVWVVHQAPVVPDGSHLHYWDSDAAALVNQRGMEISNHWC